MQYALIALSAIGVIALFVFYVAPWIIRQYRMIRLGNAVVRKHQLVLTYDDGPSSDLTPRLLDLLRSRGARAAFFPLGPNAEEYPQLVDRIVQDGHDIGCHSYQHLNAWKVSPGRAIADIERGYKSLSKWLRPHGMFRPPHGKMTAATWWWVRRRCVPVFWWTVDSGDTHSVLPSAGQIADMVRKRGGAIVLMHDRHRTTLRSEFVLEVTAALLDVAERESLNIIPLTEVCQ